MKLIYLPSLMVFLVCSHASAAIPLAEEKAGTNNDIDSFRYRHVGGLEATRAVQMAAGGPDEGYRGAIDREAIRKVVRSNLRSVRSCYENELVASPGLKGKIVLKWEIGEKGEVVKVSTTSNELTPGIAQCISKAIKTWHFEKPPASTTAEISYPFIFSN